MTFKRHNEADGYDDWMFYADELNTNKWHSKRLKDEEWRLRKG